MQHNSQILSIIIPTKNEEKFIMKCLDSIKRAEITGLKIEMIIVDNGSCDLTREIANKYSAKIIEKKGGTIAHLRNLGAKEAKGEFLAFIDADCIITKNIFVDALRYFNNPEIAAVGARPGIPNKSTWVQKTWAYQRNENGVQQVYWLSSSNFIVRKSVFFEFDGFNEDLITCEDYDLGVRICSKYKLISDENIRSIHLREPATVKDFFLKEIWRGKSNLLGFLSHKFQWQELPSIIMPFFSIGLIISFPFLFYNSYYEVLFLGCFLFFFIPFLMIFKKQKFNLPINTYIKLYFLAIVYLLARAFSMLLGIYEGILKLIKKDI